MFSSSLSGTVSSDLVFGLIPRYSCPPGTFASLFISRPMIYCLCGALCFPPSSSGPLFSTFGIFNFSTLGSHTVGFSNLKLCVPPLSLQKLFFFEFPIPPLLRNSFPFAPLVCFCAFCLAFFFGFTWALCAFRHKPPLYWGPPPPPPGTFVFGFSIGDLFFFTNLSYVHLLSVCLFFFFPFFLLIFFFRFSWFSTAKTLFSSSHFLFQRCPFRPYP